MKLHEQIAATYAVIGQDLTELQLTLLTEELDAYPPDSVALALGRCRTELRKVSLADILDRLPGGHPGPEEAWSCVARVLGDEGVTVVWTDLMREAYGVAAPLAADAVAARMAFKEKYQALVALARQARQGPQWGVSLGHDAAGRAEVVAQAVRDGKLLAAQAARYLPAPVEAAHG